MHFPGEESEETMAWKTRKGIMLKLVLVVGVLMIVGATFPREQVVPTVRSLFAKKNAEASADIRGGTRAEPGDFPEVVGISYVLPGDAGAGRCTGVRVGTHTDEHGDRYEKVATAGHCCKTEYTNFRVWKGIQIQSRGVTPGDGVTVEEFYVRATIVISDPVGSAYSYNEEVPRRGKRSTPVNDLCVILVDDMPPMEHYPVLATPDLPQLQPDVTRVWIAGFGRIKSNMGKNKDNYLYKALVKVDTTVNCRASMDAEVSNGADVIDNVICASLQFTKFGSTDQNACVGDSGGPLFSTNKDDHGQRYLIGILSDGRQKCNSGPAWYSKMSRITYAAFIHAPTVHGDRKNRLVPAHHSDGEEGSGSGSGSSRSF